MLLWSVLAARVTFHYLDCSHSNIQIVLQWFLLVLLLCCECCLRDEFTRSVHQ